MTKTYRQLSHKLRIQRGPGRPDKVSARPRMGSREDGWGEFTDSDKEPTLITFDEYDQVNIPSLLAQGSLVEWKPKPKPKMPAPVIGPEVEGDVAFEMEVK